MADNSDPKTYTTVKFVWKFRDFSKRKGVFQSSLFPTSAPQRLGKWYLQLDLRSGIFNVYVRRESSEVKSATVSFHMMEANGGTQKLQGMGFGSQGWEATFAHFGDMNKLKNFLSDDVLTIVCEIKIENPWEEASLATCESPPPCLLPENLGRLLASGSLSDVTIVAAGGAELKAHKIILAARSAVFAAMFSSPMLEKETGVVRVTDMDADVFQAMLEYMYTDKDVSQKTTPRWAHNLLAAACKYQLEGLRTMCGETLSKALTVDNVLETLALADLHSAAKLKQDCISFVTKHRFEVLRSESWEAFKLSHQSLLVELLEEMCLQERNLIFEDYSN